MKKYYVLAWDTYYPARGMRNMKEVKHDKNEAIETAKDYSIEHNDYTGGGVLYDYVAVWSVEEDSIVWQPST